jgi:hypothetical protein
LAQFAGTAGEESRQADAAGEEERQAASADAPYDASLDPRTGRPPLPIEALRLNREKELGTLRAGQPAEGEAAEEAAEDSDEAGDTDEADESEIKVELDDEPQEDSEDDQ